MRDRVGDELQFVAEASHALPANLFPCRRDHRHTDTHNFERVLLRFRVLGEPSAAQCDERTGCSETTSRFCVPIFAFLSGATLLEQIEEVRGLVVGEWLAASQPLLALVWHKQVIKGWRVVGLPRLHLEAQFVRVHEALGFRARRRVGDGPIVGPVEGGEEQLELQRLLRVFRQRPGWQ